ncbi:MAG: helicase [Cyanobacteria bacterium SID2]|nr:helicase [Cyanobacteria bacterium SID2]MBP0003979.1 helicase [Cyanobacteria bacterium SBC]
MVEKVGDSLGRLFEVGFNIGVLASIEQQGISHRFGNIYRKDLQNLEFSEILKNICSKTGIVDPEAIEKLKTWGLFLIQKAWLSGLNFFREYLQSLESQQNPEILYYQCSFARDNSIGSYPKNDRQEIKEWLSQLGEDFTVNLNDSKRRYTRKGEFLKADTLMLLKHRRQLRILAIDLSVFSVRQIESLPNLKDKTLDDHRRLLRQEIGYLKSKSVFAKLRLDTGSDVDLEFEFSRNLKRHLTAFKRADKESSKFIQAAGYAYSFYQFLKQHEKVDGIAIENKNILINAVGYTDRSLSIMSLQSQHAKHLEFLKTCRDIYSQEPRDIEIFTARQEVLKLIQRNVAKSFQDGKTFLKNLANIQPNQINIIPPHQEVIENFQSTQDLRSPHAEAVKDELNSDKTLLFLTGNPGIGKTTAIVEFLKSKIDEGFLFFYVSPRKQVNLDILKKFEDSQTGELCDDRLFCMTTDSNFLDEYNAQRVVKYISRKHRGDFSRRRIRFIPFDNPLPSRSFSYRSIERVTDRTFKDSPHRKPGVLSTLCEAIYNAINEPISNAIVATACIQSLRITRSSRNTLDHFETIFKGFYNERYRRVSFPRMRELSSRIKHIIITIDEITGDNSGVEFLHGIKEIIDKYELANPESGFNLKVVVADASIVDGKVIQQHLSDRSPEPDKIFVRRVQEIQSNLKISRQLLKFKGLKAIAINVNSYPAKCLAITYKPFVESIRYNQERLAEKKDKLPKVVQQYILADLTRLLHNPDSGQILVYIQNKRRLQELIEAIQSREKFVKQEDYLEVHADLSDEERQKIQDYRNRVKVVFMTSSASRGLSFPKSQHILVEVPQFQVEANLMEIIQVIYRGRGQFWENGEQKTLDSSEKALTFYLCDRAVYYEDDESLQFSIQESLLSLLNLLVILKTAIMTRIRGYGQIGHHHFRMIPIGGKFVSSSGQNLTGQLAALIQNLESEARRNHQNTTAKALAKCFRDLLSRGEFLLRSQNGQSRHRNFSEDSSQQSLEKSYLELQKEFDRSFAERCDRLDRLLDIPKVELGYVCGSLLLVPISQTTLAETYKMRLAEINSYANREILKKAIAIRESPEYSPNLKSLIKRGIDLIEELRKPYEYSQKLQQESQWSDRYYAIPLFPFLVGDIIHDYFQSGEPEPEKEKFRDLLNSYIRQLYPSEQILPIGDRYRDFPFVVFRSYSLPQTRSKSFSDRYLLTSSELNILNLILGVDDQ